MSRVHLGSPCKNDRMTLSKAFSSRSVTSIKHLGGGGIVCPTEELVKPGRNPGSGLRTLPGFQLMWLYLDWYA
jgi:hypothetical protein